MNFARKIARLVRVLIVRWNYARIVKRIRRRGEGVRCKVLFLVNEIAKWKAQSLYDLLESSGRYEPVIGITIADIDVELSTEELVRRKNELYGFFAHKGMRVVMVCEAANRKVLPLRSFRPDIVFLPQPWNLDARNRPSKLSAFALTCYIPYYVANYGDITIDFMQSLHREVWRYFILNKAWEELFTSQMRFGSHAGKVVGLGHTGLDFIYLNSDKNIDDNVVLYAPHWSFSHPRNPNFEGYGTFLWSGKFMLEYARRHPEFKWIFKPHPSLKQKLLLSGAMTKESVESYWRDWSGISTVCETCEYHELFLKAKAMITDSASFLTEFGATGKPLIHLISSETKFAVLPPSRELFGTYYSVHDVDELGKTLARVLEKGDDFKKEERTNALERLGIAKNYAAKRIVEYLDECLGYTQAI